MNKVASMSLKWCLFDKKEKVQSMSIISSLYKAYGQKDKREERYTIFQPRTKSCTSTIIWEKYNVVVFSDAHDSSRVLFQDHPGSNSINIIIMWCVIKGIPPSSSSKPVWMSLFCWTQRKIFWRKFVTRFPNPSNHSSPIHPNTNHHHLLVISSISTQHS